MSWPNSTPSSTAPTEMTTSVMIELVPAPAITAGMVNTPVPMMLPMTSAVADGEPELLGPRRSSGFGGTAGRAVQPPPA